MSQKLIHHHKPIIDIISEYVPRKDGQIDLLAELSICGFLIGQLQEIGASEEELLERINESIQAAVTFAKDKGAQLSNNVLMPEIDASEFWASSQVVFSKIRQYGRENKVPPDDVALLISAWVGNLAYAAREYANPEYWIGCYALAANDYERLKTIN